jgi:hypothetical protein
MQMLTVCTGLLLPPPLLLLLKHTLVTQSTTGVFALTDTPGIVGV